MIGELEAACSWRAWHREVSGSDEIAIQDDDGVQLMGVAAAAS